MFFSKLDVFLDDKVDAVGLDNGIDILGMAAQELPEARPYSPHSTDSLIDSIEFPSTGKYYIFPLVIHT